MPLPLLIVNPKSASGSTRENWTEMASEFRTHFGPFQVSFTKAPGHAIELARDAALDGRRFLIACGGDGTINEVANGILESGEDVELGVLPSGTGGDFRRTLELPSSTLATAAALKTGETKRMDVGRVTLTGLDGRPICRYFLNVSSVGLAPAVIKRVKSAKAFDWLPVETLRGKANFAFSTLQEIVGAESMLVRVGIDTDETTPLQTISLCIANSRFFGGGMKIAPDAKLDDGLLDVINVGDLSKARIFLNAHTLYRGTHASMAEVRSKKAKRVRIEPSDNLQEVLLETDGEILGKLPALYEIVPSALKIRVPAK